MTGTEWALLALAVSALGFVVIACIEFVDYVVERLERARNDRAARQADAAHRRLLDGRWR